MQIATEEVLAHDIHPAPATADDRRDAIPKTPEELSRIVTQFAASDGWLARVRLQAESRWYERLYNGPDYDIWAISWMPGQSTGFHDHGESSGAFVVVTGVLEEHLPGEPAVTLVPGESRTFGPERAHDVRNMSLGPSISIHSYSPPLDEMNEYELDGDLLVPREHPSGTSDRRRRTDPPAVANRVSPVSIDHVLAAARTRLQRLSPEQASAAALNGGAILVDIRPDAQRAAEGVIPGALIIERNVLEWRLDPASDARSAVANDHDTPFIVFCSEGYTSSLAAAALQDLGLWRATDIVGGFQAWRRSGLPNVPVGEAL